MQFINNQWTLGICYFFYNHIKKLISIFSVGLVSVGDQSCTGCGIYTDIEYQLDWISSNIIV